MQSVEASSGSWNVRGQDLSKVSSAFDSPVSKESLKALDASSQSAPPILPDVQDVDVSAASEDAVALAASTGNEVASNEPDAMANKQQKPRVSKLLRRRIVVVSCFAFVAGWADVLSVIHFGAFAAMMTGNIIALGASLSSDVQYAAIFTNGEPSGWYYLLVIASNVFGAFVACWIQARGPTNKDDRGWRRIRTSTACRTALFACSMTIAGAIVVYSTHSKYAIMLFAPAFGAQNTFTSDTKEINIATTTMTGHTQKAGMLIARMKIFSGKEPPFQSLEEKLTELVPLFASFSTLVGAIFGGLLTRASSHFSVGSASLLIAFVEVIPYALTDTLLFRNMK